VQEEKNLIVTGVRLSKRASIIIHISAAAKENCDVVVDSMRNAIPHDSREA